MGVMTTLSHSTKNLVPASHAQMKVAQKWKNQTNHLVVNQPETSQPVISQPVTNQLEVNQLVTNQLVISQPVASQLETSHQFSVMMVNGQSAQNQQPLKMVTSRVMMIPSLSTRNLEHVMHAQMKVAQKWKNQTNHLVENQPETNQPVTNQLVISQLEKNHQQENARTSPLCSVKILFSVSTALPMTLVKCLVMSNAQTVNSSWVKTERLVLKSLVNARDQNASGPTLARRP